MSFVGLKKNREIIRLYPLVIYSGYTGLCKVFVNTRYWESNQQNPQTGEKLYIYGRTINGGVYL
jgi:hypothetical protein